jgi:hypothetical protein
MLRTIAQGIPIDRAIKGPKEPHLGEFLYPSYSKGDKIVHFIIRVCLLELCVTNVVKAETELKIRHIDDWYNVNLQKVRWGGVRCQKQK